MKINYGKICCDLEISSDFTCDHGSEVRCGYPKDTIEYAVIHFFRRSEKLKKSFAQESWQMRLAKGKGGRPHRYIYCIPAKDLELPGSWAVINLTVSNIGVTVHSLKLSLSFPTYGNRGAQPQVRLCA